MSTDTDTVLLPTVQLAGVNAKEFTSSMSVVYGRTAPVQHPSAVALYEAVLAAFTVGVKIESRTIAGRYVITVFCIADGASNHWRSRTSRCNAKPLILLSTITSLTLTKVNLIKHAFTLAIRLCSIHKTKTWLWERILLSRALTGVC